MASAENRSGDLRNSFRTLYVPDFGNNMYMKLQDVKWRIRSSGLMERTMKFSWKKRCRTLLTSMFPDLVKAVGLYVYRRTFNGRLRSSDQIDSAIRTVSAQSCAIFTADDAELRKEFTNYRESYGGMPAYLEKYEPLLHVKFRRR